MKAGKTIRSVRFRVLPGTAAKARGMNRIAGACRHVWNALLDQQRNAYLGWLFSGCPARPPYPSFFTLQNVFTQMRHSEARKWLAELPSHPVRHVLKHQADAWTQFFNGQSGMPRFKGRGSRMGFTIPDAVRIQDGRIHIPRLGPVRLRRRGGNPYPDGIPKQAVFTREGGKWYCTVSYVVDEVLPHDDGEVVGFDRNVRQCALSTGEIIHHPDLARLERRGRHYQRKMARQRKGSGQRRRTRQKYARNRRRIRGIRANFAHQVSRRVANSASRVVIEDLNVKAMASSAKGTVDAPGTEVKAKSGLNREILASGWGNLERHLDYKSGQVVRVTAAYTSQMCFACGHTAAGNRRTQSTFRCQACGHTANADVNAAQNIRRRGLAQLDGEGLVLKASPMNRQMGGGVQRAA